MCMYVDFPYVPCKHNNAPEDLMQMKIMKLNNKQNGFNYHVQLDNTKII